MCGQRSFKNTIYSIFGSSSKIASVEFPTNINNFLANLPSNTMDADYIVSKHTMFPLYAPFLSEKTKDRLMETMINENGKGVKPLIGYIAGSLLKKPGLMYCQKCAEQDTQIYRESYFHRLHQVQGVLVCPIHSCALNKYSYNQTDVSRLKFIKFNSEECIAMDNNEVAYYKQPSLITISKGVEYVLNNDLSEYNQNIIRDLYIDLLDKRGLVTPGGSIRQRCLIQEFQKFYSDEFLNLMESDIDYKNEYTWIKVILRKPRRTVHPIRHILLMIFLSGSVEKFFVEAKGVYNARAEFPCLNVACKNYKRLVVTKYNITMDYRAKELVGTFFCTCGFVYSRKMRDDIYSHRKIKRFGEVWESRLKGLLYEKNYSLRELARMMGCDPKTIIRYAYKLGLKNLLNTTLTIGKNNIQNKEGKRKDFIKRYRADISIILKVNCAINRSEIKKKLYKQYIWLYQNDKIWFEANMPQKKKIIVNHKRVDWSKRDNEIVSLVKNEYEKIKTKHQCPRITISLIGRRIGKLDLLERHIHKLPIVKAYLSQIVETVEDYQVRRIDNISADLFAQYGVVKRWQLIRKAGLGKEFSKRVEEHIKINLIKYNL